MTSVVSNDKHVAVLEINAETDFVAKNDQFIQLVKDISNQLLIVRPDNLDEALKTEMPNGQTLQDYINEAIQKNR